MSLKISLPNDVEMKPRITVFGVGGAGGNAVSNMMMANLEGVDFWIANTDAQALEHCSAPNKIQLGSKVTSGMGAGSHPEMGRAAAEESMADLKSILDNTNMVFITAGMGGGTGTGAAPVIAKAAKEMNILTVGVVTKPFHFEGARRMKVAELGLEELNKYVDTLIVIPNQNLFRIANENTTFVDAFKMADNVLHSGVRGITDLITMPGLVNLDFADIRTVMSEMGKAMMGTGEADGENRAVLAAEAAISNPLLDNSSMKGARAVLINITGGADMTLFQLDAAANRIREEVDPNANIIFGSAFNATLDGKMRVSVVATGIDGKQTRTIQFSGEQEKAPSITLKAEPVITAFPKEEELEEVRNSFIPPAAVEPMGYGFTATISQETLDISEHEEEVKEDEVPMTSTPANRDEVVITPANDETVKTKTNDKEDFFDIPAFLRRKMKL